jgi:hypothetical protein
MTSPLVWAAYRAKLPVEEIGACLAGLASLKPTDGALVLELKRLMDAVPQVVSLPALARLFDTAIAGFKAGTAPTLSFALNIQVLPPALSPHCPPLGPSPHP